MNKQIKEALSGFQFPEKLVMLVTGGRKFGKYPNKCENYEPQERLKIHEESIEQKKFVHSCLFDVAQLHGGRTSWLLEAEILYDDLTIVEGNATGADRAAQTWAKLHAGGLRTYPADWDKHGKSAGSIRNQLMLFETQPHIVLAFPGGVGTADMVRKAKRAGVKTIELTYPCIP